MRSLRSKRERPRSGRCTAAFLAQAILFLLPPRARSVPEPLTQRDAQRIYRIPRSGSRRSMATTRRSHIGDIDIGGKFSFTIHSAAALRPECRQRVEFPTAVGAVFRIPTGHAIRRTTSSTWNGPRDRRHRGQGSATFSWPPVLAVARHPLHQAFADDHEFDHRPANERLAALYRSRCAPGARQHIRFETTPRIILNDSSRSRAVRLPSQAQIITGNLHNPGSGNRIRRRRSRSSYLDLKPRDGTQLGGGISFSTLLVRAG